MSFSEFKFFFTDEDPRELPKGSRDPLRFIPEWSVIGREMIPYLTTVTPSYRGFLTRFLFHGALNLYGSSLVRASAEDQWPAFCRFEQLCAVVRSELNPKTPWLPGMTSVPGRLHDGVVTVSSQSSHWLGISQKTTGFWGYYHQACRGSQILELNKADRPGYVLTERAREAFEKSSARRLMEALEPHIQKILDKQTTEIDIEPFESLARYFAQKPNNNEMGSFWSERLLTPSANPEKADREHAFATRVRESLSEIPTANTAEIWEALCEGEESDSVAIHARSVRATEAIIGLCEWVFDVCRLRGEDEPTLEIARDWALRNGFDSDWLDRLRVLQDPKSKELSELRRIALTGNDTFIAFANAVLERHKRIMLGREGAPWVSNDGEGGLTVREPSEDPQPPDLKRFTSGVRWRYEYFLGAWVTSARELGFLHEISANA